MIPEDQGERGQLVRLAHDVFELCYGGSSDVGNGRAVGWEAWTRYFRRGKSVQEKAHLRAWERWKVGLRRHGLPVEFLPDPHSSQVLVKPRGQLLHVRTTINLLCDYLAEDRQARRRERLSLEAVDPARSAASDPHQDLQSEPLRPLSGEVGAAARRGGDE